MKSIISATAIAAVLAITPAHAQLTSQLGILDLTANEGINPATGEAWQHADSYRLAFITSTDSFPESSDIETYNAEIQALADASSLNLNPVKWNVIGSTTTVDARDNTSTNPNVNGAGHSIFILDGTTVIANDFNELWSGTIQNPINIMDNGSTFDRTPWPYTGTLANGTKRTGTSAANPQRTPFGGSAPGQGTLTANNWWIYRVNTSSTSQLPYYGMSERLFVIDTTDTVAPNVVSIEDDALGAPVTANSQVVYTVTFDEAMLPSSVNPGDFGNEGSASLTIDSAVQQQDAAVFQVTVTPTTEGTLQLRINQNAVLTDLNGNPLDTSTAILDDTVITVETVGYTSWAAGFAGLTNSDPTLDFDGGGLETGLEWVLGGDPTDPSDDASIAPTFDNTSDPDFFTFTYRRTDEAAADANTTIAVEYSSDLVNWTDAVAGTDVEISVDDDGAAAGIDLVEVKIRRTLAVGDKLFARLNVVVDQP